MPGLKMVKESTNNLSVKHMPVQPPTKSRSAVADKPANTHVQTPEKMSSKVFDPFHPDMPEIPGLVGARRDGPDGSGTKRVVLIGIILVVVLLAVFSIVWWIKN